MTRELSHPLKWRSLVGESSEPVVNRVLPATVEAFADAIGEGSPLCRDPAVGAASAWGACVAPTTFPRVLDYGSVAGLKLPDSGVLHGAQCYEFVRPIRVGEELACHGDVRDVYAREGRSGALVFVILGKSGSDAAGELVYTAEETLIVTASVLDPEAGSDLSELPRRPAAGRRSSPPAGGGEEQERGGPWRPGDALEELMIPPVNADRLERYARASGDLNPIHLSEEAALKAGLPGIIQHGMLTMAQMALPLSPYLGQGFVRHFDARFRGMLFIGEPLHVSGRVTRVARDDEGLHTTFELAAGSSGDRSIATATLTFLQPRKPTGSD